MRNMKKYGMRNMKIRYTKKYEKYGMRKTRNTLYKEIEISMLSK